MTEAWGSSVTTVSLTIGSFLAMWFGLVVLIGRQVEGDTPAPSLGFEGCTEAEYGG
ncbi:MAG TPA: hypothetical protein VEM60_08750 [Candidatus Dormibacteraeota bacterium]|nr:hypothetical protein [Candidatus Dormibacteraeota bacterium]